MTKKATAKKEQLTEVVQVKMPPSLKAALDEEAERMGIATSQLMRILIKDELRILARNREKEKDK
jgi:antitoxin component of RelBE/YafQ-DinJ toxin-antitoxin module